MQELSFPTDDGYRLFATVLGQGPPLVLLHAGGPDRWSMLPLARLLRDRATVILPDIRGYGQSTCADPALHTWRRYTDDLIALLDHLDMRQAVVGGAGLGSTVSLRAALQEPDRISGVVLIGVEDIEEDDAAKAAEIAFLDAFAARAAAQGLHAAWEPILATFPEVVGAMVRDAIPRSSVDSIVAAAAIGHDRSFADVAELRHVAAPTLVIPGNYPRHPRALAERCARVIPGSVLAPVEISAALRTAEGLADTVAPSIRAFLARLPHPAGDGNGAY
ncbi:alpha/beta hydrolase [Lipingzhangella sp. LS1_29]|uniref:Alpha/beta hydrolase n=1 Tax=Lipingzhangella rawalii TaxID=2055835 RepID=A0ABU2HC27_9ACTN|nr:alpha/beta hydrolase [Lipingzhangella rawalii]MDS1272360.1 alpha/beta hydrolase [Lipingzhangella rawalii]